MPRSCTVCAHPQRAAIDQAVVAHEPLRRIAARFRVPGTNLRRHAPDHVAASLAKAAVAKDESEADTLLDQVRQRLERAERHVNLAEGLCGRAASSGDIRGAVAAVSAAVNANREVRSTLELMGKLQGQLAEQAAIAAVQLNVGNPFANLSDTELDERLSLTLEQRDQRILEVLERARQRQERGEIAPGTAAVLAEAYGPNHPKTTLAVKLDDMNTIRQGEPDPGPSDEQADEVVPVPAPRPRGVVGTPYSAPPRPRPSVAPVAPRRAPAEPTYWTRKGW